MPRVRTSSAPLREPFITLALACICIAAVYPIASRPGWPQNHDFHAMFERVEAFRREFVAGHFFPLWTPFCFDGHGSPMPFLYHRLFNSVAGLIAVPLGTVRAVKTTLVLSLLVGSLGMSACARALHLSPWVRLWAGAMLPIASYTCLNWIVRGAAAELTAGMIATWLIHACLRMHAGRRFGFSLGVSLLLLFYAHIAIFLYSLPMVAIAIGCSLHVPGRPLARTARPVAKGVAQAALLVIVGAAPYALGIVLIGQEFSLDRLSMFVPQNAIRPLVEYFVDPFPWGRAWRGTSVEIGRFLLGGLGLAIALSRPGRYLRRDARLWFLATCVTFYFALQLPIARPFYESIPRATILQFPWRLLVFITPLVILALARVAGWCIRHGAARATAAALVLAGVFVGQARVAADAYRAEYDWISPEDLEAHLEHLNGPYSGGEFVPKGLPQARPPRHSPFVVTESGCSLTASSVDLEGLADVPFGTVDLELHSREGCTVQLSQFRTVLIAVEASPGGRVMHAHDGTTLVVLPRGRGTIHIERRGMFSALLAAIEEIHARR